jgi:glycosyltransferase involved in cell wall biosynthesis
MKRICFISLKSYDLIRGSSELRYVGGAERQQVLVGQGLRDLGYQVSFVTLDYGQPDGIEHNGIRVFKAYDTNAGLPVLRFFWPRWTGLWAAMRRANADVYHQMVAGPETGQVALWCRRHNRKFVFAVASDPHCRRYVPSLTTRRERWLYFLGLARADAIVVQTLAQQADLRQNFRLNSALIPSCTSDSGYVPPERHRFPKTDRLTLLWVSRLAHYKRLEWLLDLAARCPAYRFLVVGDGDQSDQYVRQIKAKAQSLPNVELFGRIPDCALWPKYEQADLFLDTASVAGVPTTFLEAWARGVPVVSTVNPDDILTLNNLGRVVSNVDEMSNAIAGFVSQPTTWWKCSVAAREYFEKHHTVKAVAAAYNGLLENLHGH